MKTTYKTWGLICLVVTASCSKNDDVVKIQAHDENQMMSLMHGMMNEMHTMKVTQDPDIDMF